LLIVVNCGDMKCCMRHCCADIASMTMTANHVVLIADCNLRESLAPQTAAASSCSWWSGWFYKADYDN